jgi:hypothetical protein
MTDPDAYQQMVTTEQLRDYMSGIGLDADQAGAAQDILDGLVRELERYCQKPLERKERTQTLWPDDYGRIFLPASPVVSVSVPSDAELCQGGYIVGPFLSSTVFQPWSAVTVTYVGGIEGKDEADVRLAILRIAAREVDARHDDTLSVSDLETSRPKPDPTPTLGWTDDELKKFDRLRRRTIA